MQQLIKQLREASERAMRGPWEYSSHEIVQDVDPWKMVVGKVTKGAAYMEYDELVLSDEDANLIILMRNNLVTLLDYVESLEAKIKELT